MTAMHALFVRRVREELKARGLNPTKLEEYGVKQRTLADVLRGADPRLSTIHNAATALGMKAADLLREGPDKRVLHMSDVRPIPMMLGEPEHEKSADRKKNRR